MGQIAFVVKNTMFYFFYLIRAQTPETQSLESVN